MKKFCLLLLLLGCSQNEPKTPFKLDEVGELRGRISLLKYEIGRVEIATKWRSSGLFFKSDEKYFERYSVDGDTAIMLKIRKLQLAEMVDQLDRIKRGVTYGM